MSRLAINLLALSLCAMGCNHQSSETAAVEQQIKSGKPIVALVPVIDHAHSDLTWNLSQELSFSVRTRLLQQDHLYLIGEDKIQAITKKLSDMHDPFGANISWIKRAFAQHEFVVFMELVEHDEVPLYTSQETIAQDSAAELNMKMRVRVVDVRGAEPKIVLQELIHHSQHIPRQFTKVNFYQVPWGHETFDISPLGMAHAQLAKELSSRLEDYILISEKNRSLAQEV